MAVNSKIFFGQDNEERRKKSRRNWRIGEREVGKRKW
jgi:hypothetical protein